jgi:homoserine kinase
MEDRLHQPYRAPLIPGLMDILRGVNRLDRVGIALSGAGPSLICVIERAGEGEFYEKVGGILKGRDQDYVIQPVEFDLTGARVIPIKGA